MYICVCVYIHAYICIYMCVYIYIYMYIRVCVYIYMYIYVFHLGVKIQLSTRMWYIPSKIIYKFPVTEAQLHQIELYTALKSKRIKNCYSPNTSWDEHDVYLTSGLNSAGFSVLREQMDLASPSIWQQHMQFTSHMGSLSGNHHTIKCHKELL